ncbi:predicted protein [Nematostella vectensis]|uniref:Uncharacterized protein n=1 Tax=Nematostella vectensis TaxID=45351 RepID=A7T126_NEMVE|nr:predicted protein [Nematostella vectensis]|eukprot:XP_001622437.1 predicted protein [Nematostella vectensis]
MASNSEEITEITEMRKALKNKFTEMKAKAQFHSSRIGANAETFSTTTSLKTNSTLSSRRSLTELREKKAALRKRMEFATLIAEQESRLQQLKLCQELEEISAQEVFQRVVESEDILEPPIEQSPKAKCATRDTQATKSMCLRFLFLAPVSRTSVWPQEAHKIEIPGKSQAEPHQAIGNDLYEIPTPRSSTPFAHAAVKTPARFVVETETSSLASEDPQKTSKEEKNGDAKSKGLRRKMATTPFSTIQKRRQEGNSASVDLPYTTSLETTIDYLNSIHGNPIDPTKLLDLLGFDGYTKGQQHDVHEAFTAIMVKLRDEKSYSAREFEGNITYAYKCVACNAQERLNSDIFDCITAEIAEKGEGIAIGTKDCVEEFWNEETLGTENKVICHKCNLKTTHRKSTAISSHPRNLQEVYLVLYEREDQKDVSVKIQTINQNEGKDNKQKAEVVAKSRKAENPEVVQLTKVKSVPPDRIVSEIGNIVDYQQRKTGQVALRNGMAEAILHRSLTSEGSDDEGNHIVVHPKVTEQFCVDIKYEKIRFLH